jgi:hypothetical protein
MLPQQISVLCPWNVKSSGVMAKHIVTLGFPVAVPPIGGWQSSRTGLDAVAKRILHARYQELNPSLPSLSLTVMTKLYRLMNKKFLRLIIKSHDRKTFFTSDTRWGWMSIFTLLRFTPRTEFSFRLHRWALGQWVIQCYEERIWRVCVCVWPKRIRLCSFQLSTLI